MTAACPTTGLDADVCFGACCVPATADEKLRESADWCASDGGLTICGTAMREHSRDPDGIKWCFRCRKRHEFFWVVMVPDGFSYYGPTAHMEGVTRDCSDLFPGWYREVDE